MPATPQYYLVAWEWEAPYDKLDIDERNMLSPMFCVCYYKDTSPDPGSRIGLARYSASYEEYRQENKKLLQDAFSPEKIPVKGVALVFPSTKEFFAINPKNPRFSGKPLPDHLWLNNYKRIDGKGFDIIKLDRDAENGILIKSETPEVVHAADNIFELQKFRWEKDGFNSYEESKQSQASQGHISNNTIRELEESGLFREGRWEDVLDEPKPRHKVSGQLNTHGPPKGKKWSEQERKKHFAIQRSMKTAQEKKDNQDLQQGKLDI